MWPAWLRWLERLIMVQALCSVVPAHLLGWPGAGYRWWMYISLVLVLAVTIRRAVSLGRMRPGRSRDLPGRGLGPSHPD